VAGTGIVSPFVPVCGASKNKVFSYGHDHLQDSGDLFGGIFLLSGFQKPILLKSALPLAFSVLFLQAALEIYGRYMYFSRDVVSSNERKA
jgi:hypothetical protein